MYEKGSTFLRLEVLSNRPSDFGLKKSLDHLDAVRQTLTAVTDRFAAFEASAPNVHIDFPLFQRLALPITTGRTRVPGIKMHDTRMVRLMEVLLHTGTQIHGWRTAQLHEAILTAFGLTPTAYTLTQLRYDVRKMKATASSNATAPAMPIGSPIKATRSPCGSSCSTSACADHWPTVSSIGPRNPSHHKRRWKRLIEKPTNPFSTYSSSWPLEVFQL